MGRCSELGEVKGVWVWTVTETHATLLEVGYEKAVQEGARLIGVTDILKSISSVLACQWST